MARTPAVVIGGYLGAGKTTLVNHLLRHAEGRRVAVLVNDFGEVSIDADLIEGAEGGVMNLAGGCVCCSFGSDLVGTLASILARQPAPDVVLIETSGVGIPSAVARSAALAPGLRIDATVVVADATTMQARAQDAYVGDTVRQQLEDADMLVLNQVDRLSDPAAQAVQQWWVDRYPHTPCWPAVRGQIPASAVLGFQPETAGHRDTTTARARSVPAASPARAFAPHLGKVAPAADRFESGSVRFDGPVDVHALVGQWARAEVRWVRAKGIVQDLSGDWVVVHWCGTRSHVEPWQVTGRPQHAGVVAWIGVRRDV